MLAHFYNINKNLTVRLEQLTRYQWGLLKKQLFCSPPSIKNINISIFIKSLNKKIIRKQLRASVKNVAHLCNEKMLKFGAATAQRLRPRYVITRDKLSEVASLWGSSRKKGKMNEILLFIEMIDTRGTKSRSKSIQTKEMSRYSISDGSC